MMSPRPLLLALTVVLSYTGAEALGGGAFSGDAEDSGARLLRRQKSDFFVADTGARRRRRSPAAKRARALEEEGGGETTTATDEPRPPGPLKVGDELEYRVDQSADSDVLPELSQSGQKAKYKIKKRTDAPYVAFHVKSMDLHPDCVMTVTGGEKLADGTKQEYAMTGKGKFPEQLGGTFWARHVKGDTATIEVTCSGKKMATEYGSFEIDRIAVGYPTGESQTTTTRDNVFDNTRNGRMMTRAGDEDDRRRAALCGTNDKENAVCYQSSHSIEYFHGRAVARLLIQGSSLCTGWLASASNHLVTNEHCITSSTAALNTDYEFTAEAPTCGSGNCQLCYTGDVFSGATFIQDNAALDYALLQITSGDPASTYGFLSIDDRAAVIDEEIYIPQHPGGRAKELGIFSSLSPDAPSGLCHVNSFEPGCSSSSYADVGYMCDTEGGSSGSPVLARSSHRVIALHHCANCENRGVPINLVCDEICSLLGPECTDAAHCNDGNPCTVDTCDAQGSCVNSPISGCCGNGSCETGEDCNSCAADCIGGITSAAACGNGLCEAGDGEDCLSCSADCNGRQNGKPSNRFCCGDGGGENPVTCGDSRCTSGGFQCTSAVQSQGETYCCGDRICTESAENLENCEVDCDPSFLEDPDDPTGTPSSSPSASPSSDPTFRPTDSPSAGPSSDPSAEPTFHPTGSPSSGPSAQPSVLSSASPSSDPSAEPTSDPTGSPSVSPSASPSTSPSTAPSSSPSGSPTSGPTTSPATSAPVVTEPSSHPSRAPSRSPVTSEPSSSPSEAPSRSPVTSEPSSPPSEEPSSSPSSSPSIDPTTGPTAAPSAILSSSPSGSPTSEPSSSPTSFPTSAPAPSAPETTVLLSNDFETGFQNFNAPPGGNNAAHQTNFGHDSAGSLRIRHNTDASHVFSDSLDVSPFDEVRVRFWYYGQSMEDGEDFFLEYQRDGVGAYAQWGRWVAGAGADFINDIWNYSEDLAFALPAGTESIAIRFRTNGGSKNDRVYIDDVEVVGL